MANHAYSQSLLEPERPHRCSFVIPRVAERLRCGTVPLNVPLRALLMTVMPSVSAAVVAPVSGPACGHRPIEADPVVSFE